VIVEAGVAIALLASIECCAESSPLCFSCRWPSFSPFQSTSSHNNRAAVLGTLSVEVNVRGRDLSCACRLVGVSWQRVREPPHPSTGAAEIPDRFAVTCSIVVAVSRELALTFSFLD